MLSVYVIFLCKNIITFYSLIIWTLYIWGYGELHANHFLFFLFSPVAVLQNDSYRVRDKTDPISIAQKSIYLGITSLSYLPCLCKVVQSDRLKPNACSPDDIFWGILSLRMIFDSPIEWNSERKKHFCTVCNIYLARNLSE